MKRPPGARHQMQTAVAVLTFSREMTSLAITFERRLDQPNPNECDYWRFRESSHSQRQQLRQMMLLGKIQQQPLRVTDERRLIGE